ncbi:hypothetical protein O3G_MSEX008592 [Manduca sexta]|uniref:Protein stoned-B n=1 Tax=Manduca sexta TaxID=7130 RepID=A0A921ZB22_MANSE|nr:hypothetical protein O3G_MSEX008592 [Manduca sexta]
MAYNPFLNMNEPVAPVTAEVLNPFMMADAEPEVFTGENPFAASNPFSDFGGSFEPAIGDTVPADIFGGGDVSEVGAKHFDILEDSGTQPTIENERLTKPTELELVSMTTEHTQISSVEDNSVQAPARPLPPETQNLILSVTGQMEFASSHLLDRIPPTRTPSPVSVRDIHSPSPTPEPDVEETSAVESFDVNRNKPARPPPARPPPAVRPPPPRPAPPASTATTAVPPPRPAAPEPMDDINLFDAPVPTAVKPTKEAILSLYSAPKPEERQIDFLSDDIIEDVATDAFVEMPQTGTTTMSPSEAMIVDSNDSVASPTSQAPAMDAAFPNVTSPQVSTEAAPMDCSEPFTQFTLAPSHSSPFDDVVNEDFSIPKSADGEKNPFEMFGAVEDSMFTESSGDIFGVKSNEVVTEVSDKTFGNAFQDNVGEHFGGSDMESMSSDMFGGTAVAAGEADTSPFAASAGDVTTFGDRHTFDTTLTASGGEDHWADSEPGHQAFPESQDAFDAFSAKFDSTTAHQVNEGAWGEAAGAEAAPDGFEAEAFDPFLSMGAPPPPAATPRLDHQGSRDSTDDTFSVFIRPKESEAGSAEPVPVLAPPPRPQALPESPRFNPFDKSAFEMQQDELPREDVRAEGGEGGSETPPTPLFDEDVSVPLEDFPRSKYSGPGWEMHLRQPNKKKITGQRFWKKIFVKLAQQGDNPVVQLFNSAGDKEPFQELPLQACYSVSEIGAQQFDQFGKIFTVKLQYVFYKERPGVRPGQVTKAERITNKLSQFAAYAIQGDYQGVKEFGSDLRKLGLPVEHAPQVSQLFKLGSLSYEDVKQFSWCVEEALFRLAAHRDRALTYKMEEVQVTAVDELYVEQDAEGSVQKQIARVRLFFLGFLSGMPDVELGVNDLRRQGKEVVGRHDIIPVVTEEWIRVEDSEFHACVQAEEFTKSQIIKFKPPDACYIELMRFRVRPPKNRELPLQLKAVWCVTGNKVELRADVLVPGFASRKLGQVPCEDVAIRFPIPECWIYLFRVEKHFRYGSVKSAHRRTGKIKGIERFLGTVETLQESLIEVTSGQAKYEHQHRAIVWRMPRLPKEGQGAYTTHNLVCRMALTSYDQIPEELARHAYVEFTMPATQVSHMTVRSVSLQEHDGDPPEKYVRYLARHEYTVGIERSAGQAAPAYALAATADPAPAAAPAPAPAPVPQPPSSDSDSE